MDQQELTDSITMNTPFADKNKTPSASAPAAVLWPQGGSTTITHVHHWSDLLFSFRAERPRNFRFRSGEFAMLGLYDDTGKPIMRAYSMASPAWDEELEFYSIKVQNGPLTSRLQHIQSGDQILLKPKAVGTLVLDALLPGKRLWLFATGTGIAPFVSIIRDPDTYDRYDSVILTHTCTDTEGLAYGAHVIHDLKANEFIGDLAASKLVYFPTTTRAPSAYMGRITDWLTSGRLYDALHTPPLDPAFDRVMLCGSVPFNTDMQAILAPCGLSEGSHSSPQHYVLEKAFVG